MHSLSPASYYADWVTIPFLVCSLLITDHLYHGLTAATALMFVLGFILWTFAEYGTHRWLFHRVFRREHWLHHIRPNAYVGVPSWQTSLVAIAVLGGCLGFGLDLGTGLFTGLAVGYLVYFWAHDKFHHGVAKPGYWARRQASHAMHHKHGIEANFGVVTPVWDMLLGTYRAS